jgi:hypothetical protein
VHVYIPLGSALRAAHCAAGLGATAADFRAGVLADLFAGLGAGFADFRARAAGDGVEMRMPQHEVMCGVAHLHTVHQQADVVSVGVLSAFLQAIVNGVKAGITTVLAVMDALMHLRGLMFVNV